MMFGIPLVLIKWGVIALLAAGAAWWIVDLIGDKRELTIQLAAEREARAAEKRVADATRETLSDREAEIDRLSRANLSLVEKIHAAPQSSCPLPARIRIAVDGLRTILPGHDKARGPGKPEKAE